MILSKHKEVLKYLETHAYDGDLSKIYEKINEGLADKPYNIYITDENLIIKNTTFKDWTTIFDWKRREKSKNYYWYIKIKKWR